MNIVDVPANLTRGLLALGGRLKVTRKALLWTPNIFDALHAKPLRIEREQISEIRFKPREIKISNLFSGGLANRVAVCTRDGKEHLFVVPKPERMVDTLREALLSHDGPTEAERTILSALDLAAEHSVFPVLDNGYVYLASARLTAYRSDADWAIVIEVLGYSPRSGVPDVQVYAFGSRLKGSDKPATSHFVNPIDEGAWLDSEETEWVADDATELVIRGTSTPLPCPEVYAAEGIEQQEDRLQVFELLRALLPTHADALHATRTERRKHVPDELTEVLHLHEWHHPDVSPECMPSDSETFRMLATVLTTGDVDRYAPTAEPNSHYRHWPEGGTM